MVTDPSPSAVSGVSAAPLLSASGLERHAGGRLLWRGAALTLFAGDRLMLTGPSGSGKSLLLRALAGLDPLETGEVTFRGQPQSAWAMPEYRAGVMLVPQRPAALSGTVQDTLRAPFALRAHAAKTFDLGRAQQLLAELGRPPAFTTQDAAHLSGGEAQLVALTRALLLCPTALLLDEATSALDPETTLRAEATLRTWAAGGERALVMVSHDPAQRERLATKLLPLPQVAETAGGAG